MGACLTDALGTRGRLVAYRNLCRRGPGKRRFGKLAVNPSGDLNYVDPSWP